jgi:hypothetical protein
MRKEKLWRVFLNCPTDCEHVVLWSAFFSLSCDSFFTADVFLPKRTDRCSLYPLSFIVRSDDGAKSDLKIWLMRFKSVAFKEPFLCTSQKLLEIDETKTPCRDKPISCEFVNF